MPEFQYRAINGEGQIIQDVLEAAGPGIVADRLNNLGYVPLKIKEAKKSRFKFLNNEKKVKIDDVVFFTRQLYTLLKAGVPLLSCLDALMEQGGKNNFRDIVQEIYVSIESGNSFSDALAKQPDVFPKLYISSVRAGEMSGQLDEVLGRLASVLEHEKNTRDKIKSAMRYPIIVVIALVIAFAILITMVVPKFATMFAQMGAQLPLPTQLLIALSKIFQHDLHFIILGIAGIVFAFKKFIKGKKGRLWWDGQKLKLPIFGDLLMKNALSRFSKMFETLNRSGLPILQTLDILAETVGNEKIGQEIKKISLSVQRGEGIATPMKRSDIFPSMVVRMIAIGEQTGSMEDMLETISTHYDLEVDYAIKNMTALIEPLLTVTIGVFILFLALSIFLPMWNIMSVIH
ncbi:type II secretion system protein F [bacterium BMS3Abin05]|nr:type II secretion system protein F [bacterium BMS3Abin05]GBE26799.1 type II secretion system protein F [bacterium BMS3Bbin03]